MITINDNLAYHPNEYNESELIDAASIPLLTTSVDISIKYLNDDVPRLKKINVGDWIDLYAAEDVIIKKGTKAFVNLGIAMQLPKGFEAYILPRSSTVNKWGCILLNSMGVVDETYCGDDDWWKSNLYCIFPNQDDKIYVDIDNDPYWFIWLSRRKKVGRWILKHLFSKMYEEHRYTLIQKGDKICQFRIMPHMPTVTFNEVNTLNNVNRGGFGTTGEK